MHLAYPETKKWQKSSAAERGRAGMPRPSNRIQRNGVARPRIWTDRALLRLPREGYKHELLEGMLIMSPAGFSHGDICAAIIMQIRSFAQPRKLGKVCDGQTGFRLTRGVRRKTVLSPDVSFVSRRRVEAMAAPEKFFEGAPDLVVEVLSPGDRLAETENKVRRFFLNGTLLAWIVDPVARVVHVHSPAGQSFVKQAGEIIEGGEVLPGFKLRVKKLFD